MLYKVQADKAGGAGNENFHSAAEESAAPTGPAESPSNAGLNFVSRSGGGICRLQVASTTRAKKPDLELSGTSTAGSWTCTELVRLIGDCPAHAELGDGVFALSLYARRNSTRYEFGLAAGRKHEP